MGENCWEAKRCGREPGGVNVRQRGVCPAALEDRLHGVHNGTNAGRSCWVIAGTMCEGRIQGTFATKYDDCALCDFYQTVKKEEFPGFVLSSVLLNKVRGVGPAL